MLYFADVAGAMAIQQQKEQQAQRQAAAAAAAAASQDWRAPPYAGPVRRSTSPSRRTTERSTTHKRTSLFSLRTKSSASNHPRVPQPQSAHPSSNSRWSPTSETGPIAEDDALATWVFFGRTKKHHHAPAGARSPSPVDADDESAPRRRERKDKSLRAITPNPTSGRTGSPEQRSPSSSKPNVLRKSQYVGITAPSESMQSSLANRESGKRPPPPLRPKRSDEYLDEALRSAPLQGMSELRPVRSADPIAQSSLLRSANLFSPPMPSRSPGLGIQRASTSPVMHTNTTGKPPSPQSLLSPPPVEVRATTPEPILLPSMNAPLEKVVEEPEGFASRRNSIVMKKPSLRHTRSTPNIPKQIAKPAPAPIIEAPKMPETFERPTSLSSETLGASKQSIRDSISSYSSALLSRYSRELSSQASSIEFSWEDYVDFCYQNAAEANCEFDWEHPAFPETPAIECPWEPKREKHSRDDMSKTQEFFDHLQLTPEATPDLSYLSASLDSTSSFIPPTPADKSIATFGVKQGPHISLTTAPFIGGLTLKENGGENTLSIYSPLERQSILEQKFGPAATPAKSRLRGPSFSSDANRTSQLPPTSAPSAAIMQQSSPLSRGRSASATGVRPGVSLDSIVSRLRNPSPSRRPSEVVSTANDVNAAWDALAGNTSNEIGTASPSSIYSPGDRVEGGDFFGSIHGVMRVNSALSELSRTDSTSTITTAIPAGSERPLTPPETPASDTQVQTPASEDAGLLLLPAKAYDPTEAKKQTNAATGPAQSLPPTPPSPPYMTPNEGTPLAWSPAVGQTAGFAAASPALSSTSFKTAPTTRKRGNTLITAIPPHMQQPSPTPGNETPILPQGSFTPIVTSSPYLPSGFTPLSHPAEFSPVSPISPPPVPMKDTHHTRKASPTFTGDYFAVAPPTIPKRAPPSPSQAAAKTSSPSTTRASYSLFPSASTSKNANMLPAGLGLGVMPLGPPPSRPVPMIPVGAGKGRA